MGTESSDVSTFVLHPSLMKKGAKEVQIFLIWITNSFFLTKLFKLMCNIFLNGKNNEVV